MAELYFLCLKIDTTKLGGVKFSTCVGNVSNALSTDDKNKCVYKFKVTGESRIIAVFEISDMIPFEIMISDIASLGYVELASCQPLIPYETYAQQTLGLKEDVAKRSTNDLVNVKQLLWLEFTIEYPGKSMDFFMDVLKKEALAALKVRADGVKVEFYKVCGQRKVHLLAEAPVTVTDGLTFQLPLITENGNGTTIVSRGLHSLDDYTSRICATKAAPKSNYFKAPSRTNQTKNSRP